MHPIAASGEMAQALVAKAHAAKKDYAKAVEVMEKLVAHAQGPAKERAKQELEGYKAKAAQK